MTDIQKNIRLGQAVNLAQKELLDARDVKTPISKYPLSERTGFYYDFLTELAEKI